MLNQNFFKNLAKKKEEHGKESIFYTIIDPLLKEIFASSCLRSSNPEKFRLGEFENLILPYYEFGAINTLDLFGLDELIIFAFYYANRDKYKNVLDIGSNIGLHSILMSKLGWNVKAFEPDPEHIKILHKNLNNNQTKSVEVFEKAVYDCSGKLKFTRVKGNTTGSHISGAKGIAYGELDEFYVVSIDVREIIENVDLIKIDAEGSENKILRAIPETKLIDIDIICEISTLNNRVDLYEFIKSFDKLKLYSQKTGWHVCKTLEDLPSSHKEGSIFITTKNFFPI